MKFIHTADIHLGSALTSRFPKEIADERKAAVRNTFKKMVEYAKKEGVSAILLCGDVFDSDTPLKKDKDFFYGVVRNNPDLDFLYLRGNHDRSGVETEDPPQNLYRFSENWTSRSYGNVTVSGADFSDGNALSLYSSLSLQKETVNVVALHGQISEEAGKDLVYLKKLRGKNVDYLALGHIHKPEQGKLDDRGVFVYSGCPEGRGMDETGSHGFFLLDVEDKVTATFVPFAERTVWEKDADISGCADSYAAYRKVKEQVRFEKNDLYRINLVGETDAENDRFAPDVEKYLSEECYFVSVKDKTKRTVNADAFRNDKTLRGEFVRGVLGNANLSEEDKAAVFSYGLKALQGETDL